MNRPERNPFAKATFNLSEQGKIYQNDKGLYDVLKSEAVALDALAERQKHTRSLSEFNELDRVAQVKFIQAGGIVE